MKSLFRNLPALTLLFTSGHGAADVIYSGLKNIEIPTTYDGTFIDVVGMTSQTSSFTGWDFNPYMGGVYLSNSADFQPARAGTGGMDTVLKFTAGSTIDSSLNFATGSGGSVDHLGPQFTVGQEGYLGFKLNGTDYGWMRVVFTNNSGGAVVKDWAYNTGGTIATGNVLQNGSTVTLDSTFGSFTLGSAVTGTNQLVKTGTGTATLNAANTHSGNTNVNEGTLLINGSTSTSSAVTVAAGTLANTPVAKLGGTGNGTTTGIIGGNVSLAGESGVDLKNGGVLAPTAAASGTKLSVAGTTTFNTGSIFEWNLSADTADTGINNQGAYGQLAGTGTISGSNAIFKIVLGSNAFTDAFWDSNKTWDNIFTGAGAPANLASIFSSIEGEGLTWADNKAAYGDINPGGNGGYFTFSGTSLTWTAIPEPTTALAGLLLTAGLLRRRRNVQC